MNPDHDGSLADLPIGWTLDRLKLPSIPTGLRQGKIPPRVAALPQLWAMRQNPVGIPATVDLLADVVRTTLPAQREKRS
jgi:hypothetical protein